MLARRKRRRPARRREPALGCFRPTKVILVPSIYFCGPVMKSLMWAKSQTGWLLPKSVMPCE
jgi:hypothetical protein